jgi:hypothetical protein
MACPGDLLSLNIGPFHLGAMRFSLQVDYLLKVVQNLCLLGAKGRYLKGCVEPGPEAGTGLAT